MELLVVFIYFTFFRYIKTEKLLILMTGMELGNGIEDNMAGSI